MIHGQEKRIKIQDSRPFLQTGTESIGLLFNQTIRATRPNAMKPKYAQDPEKMTKKK